MSNIERYKKYFTKEYLIGPNSFRLLDEWFMEAGHPPVKAWYKIQDIAYSRGLIKETYIGSCKVMFFDIYDVVSIYRNELARDPYGLWGIVKG